MKKILLVLLGTAIIFGCGKKSDEDQVDVKLRTNGFFSSLGETAINTIPVDYSSKADTIIPRDGWRSVQKPVINYKINISRGQANIPFSISWPDTLYMIYTNLMDTSFRDTIPKPAPFFNGNLTFYYDNASGSWEFDGLTPAEIQSDSAGDYVRIDSVTLEIAAAAAPIKLPTITNPATKIYADDYPYIFEVNDSLVISVYGTGLPDSSFAFLYAPSPDVIYPLSYSNGRWTGAWKIKNSNPSHHWAWIEMMDSRVILNHTVTSERSLLWGIPYKVISTASK